MDTLAPPPAPVAYMAVTSVEKAQWVRLFDVFLLGPAMIYYAQQIRSPLGRLLMTAAGIGTVAYNGTNYLANRRLPEVYAVTERERRL